jgi:hypothetical protein
MRSVALAGRRIDAEDADASQFPLARVGVVRSRIRTALAAYRPDWMVSSAAAGSDLLGQEVAGELGIRRRVVLPFGADVFRHTSVEDRPGDWGARFDRLLRALRAEGNVIDLGLDPESADVYERANLTILEEALSLSGGDGSDVLALVVWEGRARPSGDATAAFARSARQRGIAVEAALTT